jgi:hypothetical protein
MLMVYERIRFFLGTAEKFQIWRAILTYDQPKMSSFSVIKICKQDSKKTVIMSKIIK